MLRRIVSRATTTTFVSSNTTRWRNSRGTFRQNASIRESNCERQHRDDFGPLHPLICVATDPSCISIRIRRCRNWDQILSSCLRSKANDDSSLVPQFGYSLYVFAFAYLRPDNATTVSFVVFFYMQASSKTDRVINTLENRR